MIKGRAKDAWLAVQEKAAETKVSDLKVQASEKISGLKEKAIDSLNHGSDGDYSHVYRCIFHLLRPTLKFISRHDFISGAFRFHSLVVKKCSYRSKNYHILKLKLSVIL